MLLIVTPLRGWRREIMVFKFDDDTAFEAFQALNENLDDREGYNITLAPIADGQIDAWIDENVTPTLWERVTRRIRYSVTVMRRAETW